jgi:hypothetical protein
LQLNDVLKGFCFVGFFGAGVTAVFLFSIKGHKFLFANWALFIQVFHLIFYCLI